MAGFDYEGAARAKYEFFMEQGEEEAAQRALDIPRSMELARLQLEEGMTAEASKQAYQARTGTGETYYPAQGAVAISTSLKGGTNMTMFDGYSNGYGQPGTGGVIQAGIPAVVGVGALALLRLLLRGRAIVALGYIKYLIARFGQAAVRVVVGAAVFSQILELITMGASDETQIRLRSRKRRYSIGANPRLNTLLKVAKRVDNIFASYDSRISKFRSRIRGGRGRTRRVAPPTAYLSAVERRQLTRGR